MFYSLFRLGLFSGQFCEKAKDECVCDGRGIHNPLSISPPIPCFYSFIPRRTQSCRFDGIYFLRAAAQEQEASSPPC